MHIWQLLQDLKYSDKHDAKYNNELKKNTIEWHLCEQPPYHGKLDKFELISII